MILTNLNKSSLPLVAQNGVQLQTSYGCCIAWLWGSHKVSATSDCIFVLEYFVTNRHNTNTCNFDALEYKQVIDFAYLQLDYKHPA